MIHHMRRIITNTLGGIAVVALATGLTACGGDTEPSPTSSPATSTPPDPCAQTPPAGAATLPAANSTLTAGEAALTVSLDGSPTRCVHITPTPGGTAAEWEVSADKAELDLKMGDVDAGLAIDFGATRKAGATTSTFPTAVPARQETFTALQVDGAYFADSLHTNCTVTFTALSGDLVAGTIACKDVDRWDAAVFTGTPKATPTTAKKLTANGWFVARAR